MRTLRILAFFTLIISIFNSCQKEYSLEGGIITLLPGTWEFRDSTIQYKGNMDTGFVETSGSTKTLRLQGTSFNGLEDFELILNTSNPAFTTGTYMASNGEANFEYSKNGVLIYDANQLIGEFIVTISSISTTNVTGTFTGFAEDSTGVLKTISAGKFTTRYDNGSSSGNAIGTLGATAGACTPVTTSGTYTQGIAVDATNTVQVTVNITTPGIYNISTNTANGVTFSKSGTFTNTGTQTVTLVGTGTPTASGPATYTVTFGTSTCTFQITYGAGAPPSGGSLGATAGSCTPATPAGTYTQGVALTAANTVTVQANVTTVGSYTISTNTVNGVTFSKTGVFSATGLQNVVLQGTGTPVNSGAQTFTVTYGTSTCTFSITFAVGTTPPTGDYYPTTANSNWVYYGTTGAAFVDSFQTTVTNLTSTFGGNTYTRFHTKELGNPTAGTDTSYIRKTTNNYFEFSDVSFYFLFDNPQYAELNFLRDNLAAGATWNSQTFSGTFMGFPLTGNIKYTIIAQAVPVTIGPFTFPDVIKTKYEVFYSIAPTTPQFTVEQWFAKGVGLIHIDFDASDQADVKRYQVF